MPSPIFFCNVRGLKLKKLKLSLVSLLLVVALAGAITEIVLKRIEFGVLEKQRDELLVESVRIDAVDKTKIYIRPIQSHAPRVFRFQVACPLGSNWQVKTVGGEISENGEQKLMVQSGGGFSLPYKRGETHKQGVISVYFEKQEDGSYRAREAYENGSSGGSLHPIIDKLLDLEFKKPFAHLERKKSAKKPVRESSSDSDAPLFSFQWNEPGKPKAKKFLNFSIAKYPSTNK